MPQFTLSTGNCLDVLKTFEEDSIDAIVTDPPYGISFMGREWDRGVPSAEIWAECLRVLKPGGHLLAFAGTRTQHRMAVNIEDAGFEVRDMLAWIYGSGFPKSHNISKAIDKKLGVERKVVGSKEAGCFGGTEADHHTIGGKTSTVDVTVAGSEEAAAWEGWGTALKPALEPITMARKPFKGTVADNVLEHGTGGLNIDASRVGDFVPTQPSALTWGENYGDRKEMSVPTPTAPGRFPANVLHDGSEEVVGHFPNSKASKGVTKGRGFQTAYVNGEDPGHRIASEGYGDEGSSARFFYVPKANKRDRDEGLTGPEVDAGCMAGNTNAETLRVDKVPQRKNIHPTVKPTDLMAYLVRMVTPEGGVVLDPFMGSGSTGKAAVREGFDFQGIDLSEEFVAIAHARIAFELAKHDLD